MRKQRINFSWPAYLSDFSTDSTQENFSRGRLKVFYKGETADHRYFSDAFAEELIKSLPYTPVVSYYDEEKDDFVGHATEQQILGIVDPCIAPTFEKDDDGVEWCVCDVVLYTERPDQVGKLAQKIVGHSQSLELDPHSVKYTVNYDERRHFKNVEFTAGRFVGVSVLGLDQKPAFTGSEFFTCNEVFENKMKLLRDYCKTQQDQKHGETQMNLQEFMKLSWGDISIKVEEAIAAEYQEEAFTMIVDMFDDSAVVRFYSYIDGSSKLMRIKYSCDDAGTVTLGTVNEVHIAYEDVPTVETGVAKTEEESFTVQTEVAAEPSTEEPAPTEETNEVSAETTETPAEETVSIETPVAETESEVAEFSDKETPVENAEVTETEKVSVADEQAEKADSSAASFAESERAELEALKREKKVNLLDSYKDVLSDEEYSSFTSALDEIEADTLETELLKKYKAYQESHVKPMRAFTFNAPKNKTNVDSLDSFVRKHLGR